MAILSMLCPSRIAQVMNVLVNQWLMYPCRLCYPRCSTRDLMEAMISFDLRINANRYGGTHHGHHQKICQKTRESQTPPASQRPRTSATPTAPGPARYRGAPSSPGRLRLAPGSRHRDRRPSARAKEAPRENLRPHV